MRPASRQLVASALADAFLGGDWNAQALGRRGKDLFGERPPWLATVVRHVMRRFPEAPRARRSSLTTLLASLEVLKAERWLPRLRHWRAPELAMGAARWAVPPLVTSGDLAAWLGLSPNELEWFADARGLERLARDAPDEKLRHYVYRWIPKRTGGHRLLEAPKQRTKALQRAILGGILDVIPAHDAAHGFRLGRSVRTHAAMHVGKAVVLRFDLEDFFLSIAAARVTAVFRAAGYPDDVAWALACLTTNRAGTRAPAVSPFASPPEIAALRRTEMRARTRHLPQGSPTSPALANLCAYGLDVRLTAAARSMDAVYTRYADDLVFSGDAELGARARRVETLVTTIAHDEGFAVNHRKTRVMTSRRRQHITGVVVNRSLGIPRPDYERLEAILYNCVHHGPASQDRSSLGAGFRDHLRGRVAWVVSLDARRGEHLRELFEQIVWAEAGA